MTKEEFIQLNINDVAEIDEYTDVLRVPDGLIYKFYSLVNGRYSNERVLVSTCYVPFILYKP